MFVHLLRKNKKLNFLFIESIIIVFISYYKMTDNTEVNDKLYLTAQEIILLSDVFDDPVIESTLLTNGIFLVILSTEAHRQVLELQDIATIQEARRQVLDLQNGAAIQNVDIPNCLVKPVNGEPIVNNGLPMTILERQLLLDIGALRPPSIKADGIIDFVMLQEHFQDNCCVFELARLGPRARMLYQIVYEILLARCDEEMTSQTAS